MRTIKTALTCALAVALFAGASFGAASEAPSTAEATEAVVYEWSIELDCSLCHYNHYVSLGLAEPKDEPQVEAEAADFEAAEEGVAEQESATDEAAEPAEGEAAEAEEPSEEEVGLAEVSAFAPAHVENYKLDCARCHEDNEDLAKGHRKLNSGKEATRLKKSEVDTALCTACHQAEALAEATAESTVLTDSMGTTVNPHDYPDLPSHGTLTCFECHQVHSGERIEQTAMTACVTCHHAEVFECNTCH